MRSFGLESDTVLKIGFLAPLTGPLKAWAVPGLNGSKIWVERVNAAGGLRVGGRRYMLELVPYDTMYRPELALKGAKELILSAGVKLMLMIGGDDLSDSVRSIIRESGCYARPRPSTHGVK